MSPYGNFRIKARPASAGDNQLKAGVSGKRIRIHGGLIIASGGAQTAVVMKSSAANTVFSLGGMAASEKLILPFHDNWEMGYFEALVGEDLVVNLQAATVVEFQLVGFLV